MIHAATLSPAARRGYVVPKDLWSSPSEVDRDGTARLLELAAAAGVGHILYVSIVGIDRPRVPYLRRKLEAEYLIRQGPIPGRSPERPSSTGCLTACSARWLGSRSCRCPTCRWSRWIPPTSPTTSSSPSVTPAGRLADFGGPEVLTFSEAFDQWRQIRDGSVRTMRIPLPSAATNAAAAMSLSDGPVGMALSPGPTGCELTPLSNAIGLRCAACSVSAW